MVSVFRRLAAAGAALAILTAADGHAAESLGPRALYQDPPSDPAHPASGAGVVFFSHGAQINAQVYQPAGGGLHPTVVLLHGLPGNEQNLDLARAIQRAGWTVITFHYRGSWGSGGTFAMTGGCEDIEALISRLKVPAAATDWGVDVRRLVVMGHSYGGVVAACAAAAHPDILGVGLIAPWDPSYDARAWAHLSPAEARKTATEVLNDSHGRLGTTDEQAIMRQILVNDPSLDLSRYAGALANRPLMILTATRDDQDDKAIGLLAALKPLTPTALTTREYDTDHGFNDHRIALADEALRWLATLPGAPPARAPAN